MGLPAKDLRNKFSLINFFLRSSNSESRLALASSILFFKSLMASSRSLISVSTRVFKALSALVRSEFSLSNLNEENQDQLVMFSRMKYEPSVEVSNV